MKKFCSQCGNQLPEQGKFCPKCGTPIQQQVEEVELGEVTKINTHKKSFSFNTIKTLPKQKLGIILGAVVAVILVIFFMNRNPLQGNWESADDYFDGNISVKGNKAEVSFKQYDSMEVIFSGKLRKKNSNQYMLPLNTSKLTITSYDAVDDKAEFEEEIDSLSESLSDYSLGTSDRKKIEKWIKQIKLDGSDISWTLTVEEFNEMARLVNDDLFDISTLDLFGESLTLTKKGNNRLSLSDRSSMFEVTFKKVK